jgi:hypothetical protein
MQRREAIETFLKPAATAAASPRRLDPRIGLIGLTGMILLLLMSAPKLPAEPADALAEGLPHVSSPPPAAVIFSVDAAADLADWAGSAAVNPDGTEASRDAATTREDTDEAAHVLPVAAEPSSVALEELLSMRNPGMNPWRPSSADEALAIAVANGSNPDLEPRNPFRKRSTDLFRTDFVPVTVGRAEMLMRFRLRAKSRNAVSVEVRF